MLTLVDPQERGDPMSPLPWTAKSTRVLADELTARSHVSPDTVGDLLRAEGTPQHVLFARPTARPDQPLRDSWVREGVRAAAGTSTAMTASHLTC